MGLSNELQEEVVGITHIENYKALEGKMMASLDWIIIKAYGKLIPSELIKPFYQDDQGAIHPKPALVHVMTSSELYANCAACVFNDNHFLNQTHSIILHTLKRNGVEVLDLDGGCVTETVLTQNAPLKMNAHLAVIDAFMYVFVREIGNVQQIMISLSKYPADDYEHIPVDTEESLLIWINKICRLLPSKLVKLRSIPHMQNLFEDLCDGVALVTLLSFYRPDFISIEDICYNEPMSIADSIHNLRLIKEFCLKQNHAETYSSPITLYHFTKYEDLLYMHDSLRPNVIVFLAELFSLLEKNDVKSPVNSTAKRHFGHVSIPELRSFERHEKTKSLDVNRLIKSSQKKPSVRQPKEMSSSTLSSVGSSIMNSVDSLNTSQSFDSLKYQADTSKIVNIITVDCTTFAEISPLKKSNTNLDKNNQNGHEKAFSRSFIKMQLLEKRRQIESQRQANWDERLEKSQLLSKEAFMKLYGKSTTNQKSTSDVVDPDLQRPTSARSISDNSEADTIIADSAVSSNTPSKMSLIRHRDDDRSIVISEISSAIREIKQQMNRLATEQHEIQQKLSLSPGVNQTDQHSPNQNNQSILFTNIPKTTFNEINHSGVTSSIPAVTVKMLQKDKSTKASSSDAQRHSTESISANVGYVVGEEKNIEDLSKGRENFVASIEKRKSVLAKRIDTLKDDKNRKQEEMMQKEEILKQKKRDKDLKRMLVFEEYQKKKAEKQTKSNGSGDNSRLESVKKVDATFCIPSKPVDRKLDHTFNVGRPANSARQNRPLSQILARQESLKADDLMKTVSADNIDQPDNTLACLSQMNAEPTCKVFVKPTQKSNRVIILNALEYSVFQGEVNKTQRQKCLTEIAKSVSKHFLVLFRDNRCQFRAIYSWDQTSDSLRKLCGLGPTVCHENHVNSVFKYDSGGKRFVEIPARHFSATTDAFTIQDECWQRNPTMGKSSSSTVAKH